MLDTLDKLYSLDTLDTLNSLRVSWERENRMVLAGNRRVRAGRPETSLERGSQAAESV